jgi:hypothetical protein
MVCTKASEPPLVSRPGGEQSPPTHSTVARRSAHLFDQEFADRREERFGVLHVGEVVRALMNEYRAPGIASATCRENASGIGSSSAWTTSAGASIAFRPAIVAGGSRSRNVRSEARGKFAAVSAVKPFETVGATARSVKIAPGCWQRSRPHPPST